MHETSPVKTPALSAEQLAAFHERGYMRLREAFSPEAMRAQRICEEASP